MQTNKYTKWLITHNNPKMSLQEYIEMWYNSGKVAYVNAQVEAGQNETVHIQAYVHLKK